MALDRTWYNTLIDDDGSNTVGSLIDKADIDALMDAIDASLATVATLPIAESAVTGLVADLALKRPLAPREVTVASSATPTPNADTTDIYTITALAAAALLTNPTGTPTQGQKLIVRIKDNGTARALTYDTKFRALGVALPTTTVISKTMYQGYIYNATDTKWDLVAVSQEA